MSDKSTLKGEHLQQPENTGIKGHDKRGTETPPSATKGQAPELEVKQNKSNVVDTSPAKDQEGRSIDEAANTIQATKDPINPLTGEELLQLNDFTLPDGFEWDRTYRSSHTQDIGLGIGWTHRFSGQLRIQNDEEIEYFDHEGKFIQLQVPAIGGYWRNPRLNIVAKRLANKEYILVYRSGEVYHFAGQGSILRLTSFTDNQGRSTQFSYDKIGRLSNIVTPFGVKLQVQYASQTTEHVQAIQMIDEQFNAIGEPWVQYRVNGDNDLVFFKDRCGATEHYTYQNHVITQRTLPSGFNFYFEWNKHTTLGKCVKTYGDNDKYLATVEYEIDDEFLSLTKATDAVGSIVIYEFDKATGKLLGIKDEHRSGKSIDYNDQGQVVSVSEDLSSDSKNKVAVTQYEYDDYGQLAAITDAEGGKTLFCYNDLGLVTSLTNAAGIATKFEYSDNGQLISETNGLGHTTRFEYDNDNRLQKIQQSNGLTENLERNDFGLLTKRLVETNEDSTTPPVPISYEYNELGLLQKITSGSHITRYFYDAMARPTQISHPDGSEYFEYDQLGQITKHVDTAGRTTVYEYDGVDSLIAKTQHDGSRIEYQYNLAGQLTALVHPDNQQTKFAYDNQNRLTREESLDGRVQHYEYNYAGQLVRQINGENIVEHEYEINGAKKVYKENQIWGLTATHYQRDKLGRLTAKTTYTVPPGDEDYEPSKLRTAETNIYRYDPLGRLIKAENKHSKLSFEYDALGQLIKEHQNESELSHEYNINGQRVKTTLPDGEVIEHHFDTLGQWEESKCNNESLVRVRYNAMGQPFARRMGNILQKNEYDPVGRLINQQSWIHDGQQSTQQNVILQRQYQYDAAGRIASITNPAEGQSNFSYDDQDRLLFKAHEPTDEQAATVEAFQYDRNNNITQSDNVEACYKGNRLVQWAGKQLSYNEDGQLKKIIGGHGNSQRFGYNKQGQLTKIYLQAGTLVQTKYQYDPLGRRIKKTDLKDGSHTDFIWDGDKLLQEIRHHQHWEQPETISYIYEPNSFVPLIQRRNGKNYFYHNDHLGTPQQLTDANGNTVWKAKYTAWGEIDITYQQIDNPIRFQGQYHDLETGLYYTRHRYYSPEFGRFITQDPIGLLGGLNSYQYVPNPVHWVDPLGLSCKKQTTWNAFQADHKGQFANSNDAAKAYRDLKQKQSPWPIGFLPPEATLLAGTYFQMALSPGQPIDQPGAFGTFDNIKNLDYVRKDLAVKEAWKPQVDRVVTYEVIKPLPVSIGPVGPQIDEISKDYLSGGGNQIEMNVPRNDRMRYLKFRSEKPIR